MASQDAAAKLMRRAGVLSQQVSQEEASVVLLDPKSGNYFALEAVGARVWELCDGTRNLAEIVAIIAEEFDEAVSVILADVSELLEELTSESLVLAG